MTHGTIVAAQPEAAEAGARVLMRGGNAVDAAIACALVQGVVDPQMTGIAGFGNLQVYLPGRGVHQNIDFHGKTPLAASGEMWADLIVGETRDGFGFILKDNVNDLGYQSITTPGSLMAYAEAVEHFGTWDWADIVAPAIGECERGVTVRPHMHFWWTHPDGMGRVPVRDRLAFSRTGREIYFRDDGGVKRVGDRIDNPDMAATLKRIARHGARDFYEGEIAERIAADMAANGGLISERDLREYRTTWTKPLAGRYRDFDYATNMPPGGGIQVCEMLNILENFDLAGLGHNSADYLQVVGEAMRYATADKDEHVGDPAFYDVPLARLTSRDYAAECAAAIRNGERKRVTRFGGRDESTQTTHVAVVDEHGNCVTMTHSLGMPSGVITDGLGFMFNGCMAVFDPRPGRAGSVEPGKSRFSSLCPTIVFRDGAPYVVLGAPGGTQIAMGVTTVLLNVLDHGMSMTEAVSAPRFSATSDAIDVMNRIPRYVTEELEARGYEVIRSPLTFGIAAVHGIRISEGRCDGGADPGHDGVALTV